jgi:3-phenylpropionate/trans-cinnamate dioxygenase ferredoxin reductase subunit
MDAFRAVLVGGGMVGGYCLKEMAKLGVMPGEVCLLAEEPVAPYQRPPLSKEFLTDAEPFEKMLANKEGFYEENGIVLRLGTAVTALDPAAHTVQAGAETIGYGKLVLATGSSPRRLDLPGAGLDGLFVLRSHADTVRLKEAAAQARKLVVVGGGFIGTEVGARLAQQGLDTTIAFRENRMIDFFFPPEISALYEDRYTTGGVTLKPGVSPTEFVGEGGKVTGVRFDDGTLLEADMVLLAVGVMPNVGLAEAAGLSVDRWLTVNESLQTSDPDIFAGGDIIAYPDRYSDSVRHIEHEEHARRCGRHIARELLGDLQPYDYLPMVWSDVFDLSWEFRGSWMGVEQIVHRGDVMSGQFSSWWLKDGRVIGALTPYSKDTTLVDTAVALIKERRPVDAATIQDECAAL